MQTNRGFNILWNYNSMIVQNTKKCNIRENRIAAGNKKRTVPTRHLISIEPSSETPCYKRETNWVRQQVFFTN